jgi:phosphonate transport system ATP-binding protein
MQLALEQISARHPAALAGHAAALRSVSLAIASGEHVAVIGPSGAGKTTLLHAIACALRPAQGTLLLDGRNPWALPRSALQALRGELFLAPQTPPLPPRQRVVLSVLAGQLPHIGLAASLRSLFYPRDIALAHAALAAFDLEEKIFERVDRLSGGERQRVGLARLFAAQARLWLVDEPLSALDPARATQALDTLVQTARQRGATLVCTLHQVERALQTFPRIIGLRDGEVVFDLPVQDVTQDRLHTLYAQHEDELSGAAPADPFPGTVSAPAQPAVMHCR